MTFPSSGISVYSPTFTVNLGGKKIPTEDITDIEVDEQIENSGMCIISFNDMLDMKKQKFRWLDDARIKIGTRIEISFSYAQGSGNTASSGGNTLLFIGNLHGNTGAEKAGEASKNIWISAQISGRARKGKVGLKENFLKVGLKENFLSLNWKIFW